MWHSARMRIVCPICSATYEVQDSLLKPGRVVRCARCSEQWVAIPVAAPPPPPSVTDPEPDAEPDSDPAYESRLAPPPLTAMDRLARQPAPVPRRPRGLAAAWAASLTVLLILGWGFVTWRTDVMRAWPASTRLYDMLGLVPAPPASPAR